MIKLSFIVPVYNVEQYLRKCVESLIAQDYQDYEIILVDDGSTDSCPSICDEYSQLKIEDRKLKIEVIHQKNAGLSAARNAGVKAAKGDYICFVDSDDYWEKNVLGGLMEQVEKEELDVLRFNYQNVRVLDAKHLDSSNLDAAHLEYEVFEPNKDPKRYVDYSEEVTDGETFLNERLGPACYAVMFIIKRSLLVTNEGLNELTSERCLFTEGIYFEDVDWTPRMLLRAKRTASTSTIVYNYLWRSGSITLPTDPVKKKKVLDDKIHLIHGFNEQSQYVKDSKWFMWMLSFTVVSVLGILAKMTRVERKEYIAKLNSLHIFPLSTYRANRSNQWKIKIANFSPSMYCILMSIRK